MRKIGKGETLDSPHPIIGILFLEKIGEKRWMKLAPPSPIKIRTIINPITKLILHVLSSKKAFENVYYENTKSKTLGLIDSCI